jgi:hypothetical protein
MPISSTGERSASSAILESVYWSSSAGAISPTTLQLPVRTKIARAFASSTSRSVSWRGLRLPQVLLAEMPLTIGRLIRVRFDIGFRFGRGGH